MKNTLKKKKDKKGEEKKKSIFKIAEETHQRLQKQKQDRANAWTEWTASSYVARQLLLNASVGRTGNLGSLKTK